MEHANWVNNSCNNWLFDGQCPQPRTSREVRGSNLAKKASQNRLASSAPSSSPREDEGFYFISRQIQPQCGNPEIPPMDIDDILAEVDGDAIPPETRDLQELTRAWVTERSAPEILPWPEALMDRVLARIRKQVRSFHCEVFHILPAEPRDRGTIDRARRRHNRQPGPPRQLPPHNPPNRTRTLQIPRPLFPTHAYFETRRPPFAPPHLPRRKIPSLPFRATIPDRAHHASA